MNDLIRPTLYEAYHQIIPVAQDDQDNQDSPARLMDVVGPVCETGDFLAQDRMMPELAPGSLIAVLSSGAYGAVQASTYNSRLLIPEVMVKGNQFCVIRPRPSYDDLINQDQLPSTGCRQKRLKHAF